MSSQSQILIWLPSMQSHCAKQPHGTRSRYRGGGCRCMLCRAANSRYETERFQARRTGDWNGYVSAARAREWLLCLAELGIGRRAISAASDVPASTLFAIRKGKKTTIRARTERRILNVDAGARSDRSLIPAKDTWQILNSLLRLGYTKTWIAAQLGSRAKIPALQLRSETITAASAAKIEKLYHLIEAGRISR